MKASNISDRHIVARSAFPSRHIGPSPADVSSMLKLLNIASLDELIEQTIPRAIRQERPLEFGAALSEWEALQQIRRLASKNKPLHSLIGQGYYGTILPGVIQRNVLENPAWYTAYTPYQAEISQGRLEALLNFQTMISDLTGLEIANASLLDEATAASEAMVMARRISKSQSNAFFVDDDCHPQTIAVLETRAEPLGFELVIGDTARDLVADDVFGALLQYPGSRGGIRDIRPIIAGLRKTDALTVVAADPLALTLLVTPGEMGADIAIGSTQRFGVPMGYGGPHAAYIVTRAAHQRLLPGRIVGVSVDRRGRPAYRLALQTREQHIRREKATSNICTAQVLLAVIASMFAVYHGPEGLKEIAENVHRRAATLAAGLSKLGWTIGQQHFFDTFTVEVGHRQAEIMARAVASGVNLRAVAQPGNLACIGMSCDEITTPEVIAAVWKAFGSRDSAGGAHDLEFGAVELPLSTHLPAQLRRSSDFLTHPVFRSHRSETEMLRYLRRLSDYDLALDRTMIPLGSCTMKLNATTEMVPLTWPEFSGLHPYAPLDQAEGYAEMAGDLERKLCAISGYDAISLQPNSGAQGEYAGLLCIRAFHRSLGHSHRDVCLIPASAHGTNPASAQMAGMTIVVVNCDADGNIDLDDLRAKADQHADRLAAIMVTYPSTHGVFEEEIQTVAEIVHERGGQVYLDGANLNAQVGLARPADYGADVSHFNLHKTFCIPHGGGGPGMGPIGVRRHLAPFLPAHPLHRKREFQVGAVSAAPLGSASILTISLIYMTLMGGEGLTQATKIAILNANYIAERLKGHYKLLYQGRMGRVAHECIVDTRPFKESAGVSVDDIAKRLIDYGFHAPTMSFPVPGTLMIEPTESESKSELDRFCDAMIHIRNEIRSVESGEWPREDNPLRNAPHTARDLADEKWNRPYGRAIACFPLPSTDVGKYWCPVNRIDAVHGDRHLICTCPPPSAYQHAGE
jgi:glycine dehydrogenase